MTEEYVTAMHQFEYGYEQTIPVNERSRRRASLVFAGLSESERDSLFTFFDARNGPYQQFSWTAPEDIGKTSTWRLTGALASEKLGPDAYTVTAPVEELVVFGPGGT